MDSLESVGRYDALHYYLPIPLDSAKLLRYSGGMEETNMTNTKKARTQEAPQSKPHSGVCHICTAALRQYRHLGATLITCPLLMAGGGFHPEAK
jgi:hypothetical protein